MTHLFYKHQIVLFFLSFIHHYLSHTQIFICCIYCILTIHFSKKSIIYISMTVNLILLTNIDIINVYRDKNKQITTTPIQIFLIL